MRANEDVVLLVNMGISREDPDWERYRILVRALFESGDDFPFSAEFQEGLREALIAKFADKDQADS